MKTYKLITAGLVGVTACSGVILSSLGTYADNDSATDTTTVTIPVSCMMSGTVDAPHSAELAPGTYSGATGTIYENGIGKTTLTTYCNDYNGFSIYAIGFTGNTEGDNTLKGTSASGNATIATKAYESTDATSNWSMKVTKVTDSTVSYNPTNMTITTGYDAFHAIPDSYTKVAEYKASTGSSATDQGTNALGAKVETTYAAYVAPTQAADTYTGQVKYVMVHPNTNNPNSYIINFVSNGGTGTMTPQKISRGTATNLTSNAFTAPEGMGFKEWNTAIDGSGTSYANGASVTNLGEAGGTITLFAQWKEVKTIATATTFQEVSSKTEGGCPDTLTTGQVYELADVRGTSSTTYHVARLADGNCWMLDNLALDLTNSTTLSGMDDTNTNASDTTLGYLKNGGGKTSDKYPTAKINNVAWTSSSRNYYSIPMVNTDSINTVPTDATSTAGGWKVGVYYNYCAASAGSYCYGNGTSAGTSSGNATEDLCPAGWRMPTGGSSGEYQALYSNSNYNTYDNYRAALHLPLSGYFDSGSASNQGSNGRWWSSTRSSNLSMYSLVADTSLINPAIGTNRTYGSSVRCILGS